MDFANSPLSHRRIGEVLVSRGQINDDQLHIALQKQKDDHKQLARILHK